VNEKIRAAARAAAKRAVEKLFKPGQVERHLGREEIAVIVQASWEVGFKAGFEARNRQKEASS